MKPSDLRTLLCSITTLGLTAVFFGVPSVMAETLCSGSLGAVTINDKVVVPDNQSCVLSRTNVLKSVEVGSGAQLTAQGVRIGGSIEADGAYRIFIGTSGILGSYVRGNIEVKNTDGPLGVQIVVTSIRGNVEFQGNSLALLNGDEVDGNVDFLYNDRIQVSRNSIGGELNCIGNGEILAVSGNNIVAGNKEGQCADL